MSDNTLNVLLIEDSPDDAGLVALELRRGGYDPVMTRVETAETMRAALETGGWDVIISDYSLPQFGGLAALALVQQLEFDVPFILMSGTIGEEIAVEAMRAGAHDYIMKNNMVRLVPAIQRELREAKMRQERRQTEEWNRYLARYDLQTGLPNRVTLHEYIEQAVTRLRRERGQAALLLIDLDNFKDINDTLGHSRGDALLQQVGMRLKRALRDSDQVARMGGDEFAILATLASLDHQSIVVKKISTALEPPFVIEGLPILVEASIGIALYPEHGDTPDALVQRADIAMYVAKHTKTGCAVYSKELDRHSHQRLALAGELRAAIERRQLFLHYQPKVSLQSGRMLGVEALARWRHPERGLVPPDQFIMSAERTGLIGPLTTLVLHEASAQCRAWRAGGVPIKVAVNFSTRNLQDPRFPEHVGTVLRACGVEPSCVEGEITESAIMMNPTFGLEALQRLHDMGMALAIDDFGTGYTSLGQLKKLPVRTIKIDKSFVLGMLQNDNDHAIVRSIIDLGHALGLTVVAEGVENQALWERLTQLGCDIAQGYHISRPMAADDLLAWLTASPYTPADASA